MEEPANGQQKVQGAKNTKRFYAFLSLAVCIALIVIVSALINNHTNQQSKNRVAEVVITKKGFVPSTIVVKRGTKVEWTNTDSKLHQIVANPYPKGSDLPSLKSEILNINQTYNYTANQTGSFGYHDQMHPTVNGTIIIKK